MSIQSIITNGNTILENPIINCINEKQFDKLSYLNNLITNDEVTGENIFKVIDIEAGAGKSRQVNKTLAYCAAFKPETTKTILVKYFNEDVYSSANEINEYALEVCSPNIAKGITASNYKSIKKKIENDPRYLERYHTIVITHERYKMLSRAAYKHYREFSQEIVKLQLLMNNLNQLLSLLKKKILNSLVLYYRYL